MLCWFSGGFYSLSAILVLVSWLLITILVILYIANASASITRSFPNFSKTWKFVEPFGLGCWPCNAEVPGSSPTSCHYRNWFSLVSSSTPRPGHLGSLRQVGILNYVPWWYHVYLRYLFIFLNFPRMSTISMQTFPNIGDFLKLRWHNVQWIWRNITYSEGKLQSIVEIRVKLARERERTIKSIHS